jgi:pilus assembly protein Flp/PilA
MTIVRTCRDFQSNEEGVTMIEYALIAGLISIVAITLLSSMGGKVKNLFSTVNSALTTA